MRCPACGTNNPSSQRFCGACGVLLVSSDAETQASPTPPRMPGDRGHYVPGQILGGRYRMVGLLGRGGMGEVYRADDLKLGQAVALKFLPRAVEKDPDRLQRFLDEVRLSLRVTHPNVCRVYDLGEEAGRHFISMEYVDGEDLASLLRRIGRLPEDKAVEIARQLCAGLAAAHDEGVLHRDLKPANVMIDGRGRAKITDFGLAGATAGISGREAQVGTPQYMAPEQFDGRELSVQTDLYSLGLVLYEVFTGKRAFDSGDLTELKRLHASAPTSPSTHVSGLSAVVERAILRCLAPDPAQRPRSAASLAAALPGGDPLEMAIAAGETPSPEMVAQAGGRGELSVGVAAALFALTLFGLAAVWMYYGRTQLQNLVGLPKPPEELRLAARNAIAAAGYTSNPSGSAFGFYKDTDYFNQIAKNSQSLDRWSQVGETWPPPLSLWYRESTHEMTPFNHFGTIGFWNPPVTEAGMMAVRVDPSGRLLSLSAVPKDLADTNDPWAEPAWSPLFAAAGLAIGEWQPSEPLVASAEPSDTRRAWTKGTLRIEAASMRGRPVWFSVIPEWWMAQAAAARPEITVLQIIGGIVNVAFDSIVILAGVLLARRNVRLDRSDTRGALRLSAVYVAVGAAAELLRLSGGPTSWEGTLTNNVAGQVYTAVLLLVFYLAIEPYVRRLWPETLVAWSRVLSGRFRDPMVGRHILIGAAAGMAITLLTVLRDNPGLVGVPSPAPPSAYLEAVTSLSRRLSQVLSMVLDSFFLPVAILFVVLLARVVLRRTWLAYPFVVLLGVALLALGSGTNAGGMTARLYLAGVNALFCITVLVVLTRFGLFALLVSILFSFWDAIAMTTNPSSWIFPSSVMTFAMFAAFAIYGFWTSLGDQKLFKDAI